MVSTFDAKLLYNDDSASFGIKQATVDQHQQHVQDAIKVVSQKISNHEYGFLQILENHDQVLRITEVLNSIAWADTLVVIGIGGSDLGGRTIQQTLPQKVSPMRVIFHGDSTDPEQIFDLLNQINLETTVFNVVSKSGETVEIIAQYVYFKKLLQEQTDNWAKHFVFTTDADKGVLQQEAKLSEDIKILTVPENVGGRFSVLTPVGLFPAAAMGVDIKALLAGGATATNSLATVAQEIATTQFYLYQQNIKIVAIVPYSIRLDEFGRWFRQLWAESLGKDGKGILPVRGVGPADQHSQNQFYNQGEPLLSVLYLRVAERAHDITLSGIDVAAAQYLEGSSFHQIISAEQESSALALYASGRPAATLTIPDISAATLGELFVMFELAVVYLAEMLGVNAFDQPGVETSKEMMYALLGKAGYEDKKQEIAGIKAKLGYTMGI